MVNTPEELLQRDRLNYMLARKRYLANAAGGHLAFNMNFPAKPAVFDLDFVNSQFYGGTLPAGSNSGTLLQQQLVNAEVPNFMENADGSLSTFNTGQSVRWTNKGLVSDGLSRACQIIQNRTLTNAAWVISNATDLTVLKNQIGRTQVANSANQVVVNAINATLLQSVTISGSTFYGYVDIKRLSGSGTCELTIDGGLTWAVLDFSSPIFNGWARATKPGQAPGAGTFNMGFRFSTPGDVWALDFVDVNQIATEFSPIGTVAAKVTGNFDRPSSLVSDGSLPVLYMRDRPIRSMYMEFAFRTAGGLMTASGGTLLNVRNTDCQAFSAAVTTSNAPVQATSARLTQINKVWAWQGPGETGICLNGVTPVRGAGGVPDGAMTHFDVLTNGSSSASINGLCRRWILFNNLIPTNAMAMAATT